MHLFRYQPRPADCHFNSTADILRGVMTQSQKKYFNSNDARALINVYGFALFPIHGVVDNKCTCGNSSCTNVGKHPATPNGLKDATKDIEQLKLLWAGRKGLNVGIATGTISGIFVIDIDGEEGEKDIEKLNFKIPETLCAKTGRGRHLFFKHPNGGPIRTRTRLIGNKVDIRGDGGYVAGAGSNHATGTSYEWHNPLVDIVEAPQELIDLAYNDTQITNQVSSIISAPLPRLFTSNGWSESDCLDLLSFISPDIGYDEWIKVGMALQSEGFGFNIWDNWSRGSSSKYQAQNMAGHWKSFKPHHGVSFGTLVKMAQDGGWMRVSDKTEILTSQINILKDTKQPEKSIIKDIKFTGLIGDTINDILATSQKPQPELATLNVLAALGAVYGRRYSSPMDTRTNLYTVGVASTGSGKDHSRKYIKNLMLRAKMESIIGDDTIVSGAGLLKSISQKPSQVMHVDEFGMVLSEIKNKNAANYMKVCAKILTELYSSSNGFYYGGQYADPKREPVRVNNPNLCIYGTTTLNKYIESLDKSVIESGEINRYIIIKTSEDFPKRVLNLKRTKASGDIVDRWNALIPSMGTLACDEPEPIAVTWQSLDDRINELFLFQDEKMKSEPTTGALWARYAENVIKIAMICAITRDHLNPTIENVDIENGESLVSKSVNYMSELAMTQMYDSEHERICNRLLDVIKKFGSKMPKREISNRTRELDNRTRDTALQSLEERGGIIIETDKNAAGRICYFITAK